MSSPQPETSPPARGITVGSVPHKLRVDWPLRLLAGTVLGLAVAMALLGVLALAGARQLGDVAGLAVALILGATMLGYFYTVARLATVPVIQVAPNSMRITAGTHSITIPEGALARIWIAQSESIFPVLCFSVDSHAPYALTGIRWRLKALANQQLFGTPFAAPLTNTGFTEAGLRDAARRYLDHPDVPEIPSRELASTHRRFRRRLIIAESAVALIMLATVWVGTATYPAEVPATILLALAAVATALIITVGALGYTVLVPFAGIPWLLAEPVVRIGPTGVEHIVRGKLAHLPWAEIRQVHVARDRAGIRYLCVTTPDPSASMPPVAGGAARARRNQRRFGAPVAAPLIGAGLTGSELLDAVRHYSGGRVAIG